MNLIPLLPPERHRVTQPAQYKGSDANVWREGFNSCRSKTISSLPAIEQAVRDAVLEEVMAIIKIHFPYNYLCCDDEYCGKEKQEEILKVIASLK